MEKYWIKIADNSGPLFAVRDDGTITYDVTFTHERARAAFDKQFASPNRMSGVGHEPTGHEPAITNHTIAVIRSIREESESEKLERELEPRPGTSGAEEG